MGLSSLALKSTFLVLEGSPDADQCSAEFPRFQSVFVMNFGFLLLLPLFQYIACGKHFLVETQDSQSIEENTRNELSNELIAESDEKIVNQV